jgi:hypothetical protein
LSAVEQKLTGQERTLHLQGIRFDVYEGAIKRYGYVGKVRDDSLREISSDINLDFKQLQDDTTYLARTYKA